MSSKGLSNDVDTLTFQTSCRFCPNCSAYGLLHNAKNYFSFVFSFHGQGAQLQSPCENHVMGTVPSKENTFVFIQAQYYCPSV